MIKIYTVAGPFSLCDGQTSEEGFLFLLAIKRDCQAFTFDMPFPKRRSFWSYIKPVWICSKYEVWVRYCISMQFIMWRWKGNVFFSLALHILLKVYLLYSYINYIFSIDLCLDLLSKITISVFIIVDFSILIYIQHICTTSNPRNN